MRAPWVKRLVAVFVFIAMFTYSVEAVNCSAVKVPHLEKIHYLDYSVIIGWSHTVPNATYNISGCCTERDDGKHSTECSRCPTYTPVSNCHVYNHDKKSGTQCQYAYFTQMGLTHYFNLTVDVPGCRKRYQVSSLNATSLTAQARPVTNLTLTFQPAGLLGKWRPHDQDRVITLCYRYSAYKVLDSGEKRKLDENFIPTLSVIVPMEGKLPAYTLFEFCVKIRLCKRENIHSDEKCVRKRTQPAAPSKPVKMLCGREGQVKCFTVKNGKQRNVTLVWELPEKSSWNGLATVIKIKIELTSKEQNRTFSIIVNAAETNYTLKNLRRDGQYLIQLQFCSNGGDGPSTTPVLLSKDIEIDNTPKPEPKNDKIEPKVLVIIIVSSVVVIVAVIVIFTYLVLKSKGNENKSTLPQLQPPGHDPVHSGTDPGLRTNPTDYDLLVLNSDETRMYLDLPDKASSSGSTESTNDSASCPLVKQIPDISPESGNVDVTYYPEKSGSESGSLISSGDGSSSC